jgi:hypothetical protein
MTAEKDEAVTSRQGAHHQSSIETILDGCSWQYYLANELQIPTKPKPHALVGTSFHSAIELHENARLNNTVVPTLKEMIQYANDLIIKDAVDIDPNMMVGKDGLAWDVETLTDMCEDAITNWYKVKPKDSEQSHREWLLDLTPIAIEPYFKLDLVENARPIGGWIDGVYKDKNGKIILVDEKTAGDFSRWSLSGDGHRYQATMYAVALLLSEDFPDVTELDQIEMTYLVSRTRGGNVERARRVVVKPELDDVKLLGDRIRETERVINTKDYAPNPSWILCSKRFCPFFEGCRVTKELSQVPVEIINKYKNLS